MKVRLGVKAAVYPNGEKLSDVMAWNHYGTEKIPPRPVLRIAAENTIPKNKERIIAFLKNIMTQPKSEHKRLEAVLLQSLGSQSAAEAKRIIEAGDQLQHNAPATVAKKGFDKPLYETGLMKKNISYEIAED